MEKDKIYNGDALVFMKEIPDKYFGLTIQLSLFNI